MKTKQENFEEKKLEQVYKEIKKPLLEHNKMKH